MLSIPGKPSFVEKYARKTILRWNMTGKQSYLTQYDRKTILFDLIWQEKYPVWWSMTGKISFDGVWQEKYPAWWSMTGKPSYLTQYDRKIILSGVRQENHLVMRGCDRKNHITWYIRQTYSGAFSVHLKRQCRSV